MDGQDGRDGFERCWRRSRWRLGEGIFTGMHRMNGMGRDFGANKVWCGRNKKTPAVGRAFASVGLFLAGMGCEGVGHSR